MITFTVYVRALVQILTDISSLVFDSLEFARTGRTLQGTIQLSQLDRLDDLLASKGGELVVWLDGWLDDEGKSWLQLVVRGEPELYCQRCLRGVKYPLHIDSKLQLIAPGEVWPDDDLEDDSADAIEADKAMALMPLVEEEVLLALPIAPMHEECESPVAAGNEHGLSPFAALAALKKH